MADEHLHFSRLVLRRAWRNTWWLLKDRTIDVAIGGASVVVGAAIFLRVYGWDEMTKEVVTFLAFALAPAGLFLVFAFLWNLCLASDELVYEAISGLAPTTATLQIKSPPQPVNWGIWKKRTRYAVDQFAAILAKLEPMAAASPAEKASFRELILEAIKEKELEYVREFYIDFTGHKVQRDISEDTEIKKEDAIAWAEDNGFSVDHVK
jgi:hypothetical protein